MDKIDCFFQSLDSDFRQLNDRDYFMAKAEIQSIVNKYQTAQFQSTVRSTNT